jgi:hypothetical protein
MSSMISLPSEISVSKLEFGPVKVLDSGGKSVNIRYEGRNLMIETPSLNVPYGVNKYDKTPGAPIKYSVDLSFRGADDNEEIRALQEFMEAFDERMIDVGMENADKWFKMKAPSREVIKAFYTPLVKVSVDKDGNPKPYPPTFKLALRKRIAKKGEAPDPSENVRAFETKFYNAQEKDGKGAIAEFDGGLKIDELLPKRSQVGAIIQCTGIWFAGGKYGTTWKVVQMRVDSQPEQIRGPAFRSEAPDIRAFTAARGGAGTGGGYDDDEAGDDGGEESVVAAVTPAPVVAKPKAAVAAPAPAPTFDEEAVTEPIAVPKPKAAASEKKRLVPKAKATA